MLPDPRDHAASRRAAAELRRGLAEIRAVHEADRLTLLRRYVSDTVRAVCLPLIDLQDAGGTDIDFELRAMRPPEAWPWSDVPASADGFIRRMTPPRLLHVVRPRTEPGGMLALHVNGPSLEIVVGLEGWTVWTRHGRGRIRRDLASEPPEVGAPLDQWCPLPPFAGQGYLIAGVEADPAGRGVVGHFDVGWMTFKCPWDRLPGG